jgi:hypothetical protein
VLKVLPLALYVRAAACEFGVPILGCDGPLCPVAIGKKGDCQPTANTQECMAWCEHGWQPWANGLLRAFKIPYKIACSKKDGFMFMKIIASVELLGYAMLWAMPRKGAFLLSLVMVFGIHFHMTHMKDSVDKLGLQFVLLFASIAVYALEGAKSGTKPKPPKSSKSASKKRN